MAGLHREKRKFKTKSGKVAYRNVMVAQGQPNMRLRLNQGGPAKHSLAHKFALAGAVTGAATGAATGAVLGAKGGAAWGMKRVHSNIMSSIAQGRGSYTHIAGKRPGMLAGHYMKGAAAGALLGGAKGATYGTVAGTVLGAAGGYALGRGIEYGQRLASGKKPARARRR